MRHWLFLQGTDVVSSGNNHCRMHNFLYYVEAGVCNRKLG